LLSVHLHAQSQIIRDVIKEVLKTDAEDNSILDAHKIALCQDVKDSVCESVKDPVTKAFYKTMREVLIPAYERTTQNIFEQVASAVIESNANNNKDRRTQLQHQQDVALQISAMSENLTRMMQSMASLNEQVTQLRSQVEVISWLQDIAVILNPSDPTIERHVGTSCASVELSQSSKG
jgi:methyl-accepting chemotaxis protein